MNYIWRYCTISLLLLACGGYSLAQNGSFTLSATAAKIGIKDAVQITYTIKDIPNINNFEPLGLEKDFKVVQGPYQSNSMTIVNNRQSSSSSVTFVVQPKHEGNLTIPAGQVKDATGRAYLSNTVNIQVVPGSLAAQQRQQQQGNPYDPFGGADPFDPDPFGQMMRQRMQQRGGGRQSQGQQQQQTTPPVDEKELAKDIFIKVTVDKSKVHVGEQITTSYKLYSRIPMQVNISKLPTLNGFWTQDFEIPKTPKPEEEIVNGKKYQVFLLKKSALFPQQTGTLELDPAEAQGTARIIQQVRQRNPFADMFDDPAFRRMGSLLMSDPMFNNGFFNSMAYREIPVHLKSTPVKITVTPLPDKGKPADYSGAVGNFSITSKVSKTELTTDDATNFTINISGSGNLKLIEVPKLNLPNGLDSYDPQVIDTITGRSTTISGSKIISYPITPHTPGDYEIPAISFSYYNPATGEYVSEKTQPVKIHVTPGKHYNPNITTNNTNIALKDIHNINTQPIQKLVLNNKPLLFTPVYWSMYALPLLSLLGVIVWKKKEEEESRDTALLRNKRANKVALKRLTTAKNLLAKNDRKPFYDEVSKATWLYLSDKLGIPLSSLSRESAQSALAARKVPQALLNQLENVITECETALYAQTGGSKEMQQTYKDAVDVISKLEGVV